MKKIIMTTTCAALLCFGGSAMASSIYYEATNVTGNAVVNYGLGLSIDNPAIFGFTGTSGSVDENLSQFTAGEYTISFSLNGFWMDFNGDNVSDFALPDTSFTTGAYMIPTLPPFNGTAGALAWSVVPNSGGSVSYDFGNTGSITNNSVNTFLAGLDQQYNGGVYGVLDANVYWDTLRIELNSTVAVPEPSSILMMGIGLLGLMGYSRRRCRPGKVA